MAIHPHHALSPERSKRLSIIDHANMVRGFDYPLAATCVRTKPLHLCGFGSPRISFVTRNNGTRSQVSSP